MHLVDLTDEETRRAIEALQRLRRWLDETPKEELDKYKTALETLRDAIHVTTKYQRRLRSGEQRSQEQEDQLSRVWWGVAEKLLPYNRDISYLCEIKGWGWSDQQKWNSPEYRDLPITLDYLLSQYFAERTKVRDHENVLADLAPLPTHAFPEWAPIAAVLCGVGTLLFFMMVTSLTLFGHGIPPSGKFPVIAVFSLGVALAFAFIGGNAAAKGSLPIPLLKDKPVEFSVAGGIAVFVIVLLLSNAIWPSDTKPVDAPQKMNPATITAPQSAPSSAPIPKKDFSEEISLGERDATVIHAVTIKTTFIGISSGGFEAPGPFVDVSLTTGDYSAGSRAAIGQTYKLFRPDCDSLQVVVKNIKLIAKLPQEQLRKMGPAGEAFVDRKATFIVSGKCAE